MELLSLLFLAALVFTATMFGTKSAVLGFPSGIFWALVGGHSYTLSSSTWDIEYLIFFASMGMVIFCIFIAYGLRTKKEEIAEGDTFIDEGKDEFDDGGEDELSYRERRLNERINRRLRH